MPRVHSPDIVSHEMDGVLPFEMLRQGFQQVEQVSTREWKDLAEAEAFMNEMLVIEVHTSTDKNAPLSVPVGINGVWANIPRGRKVQLPRSFVEKLAQSQVRTLRTETNPDRYAEEGHVVRSVNGQEFPFTVHQDRNPKGRQWLERVIREGS